MRRVPVFVLLLALLAGGAYLDRVDSGDPDGAATSLVTGPVAAPASALTSTWFCAGATAEPNGAANGTIVVANPTDEEVTGTATFVGSNGQRKDVSLRVPARSRRQLRHADAVQAPFAAATVEIDGGSVVVDHTVDGPLGQDAAPCASSASRTWHVADGSTARDARMLLSLFNPFPEDAIADLAFATEQGRALPADFQGVVVPAQGLVVVDVGAHVRRREQVAATVRTRSGRLVVDRIQTRNAPPRKGVTLLLAAPSSGREWWFPDGVKAPGIAEQIHVYNPGDEEALVDVEVMLDEGDVEPFELTVAPRDRITLDVAGEERIPAQVAHAIAVRSLNDAPVVVERTIAAAGSGRQGISSMLGVRQPSRRLVFAAGTANAQYDEWIVLQNTGTEAAVVDVIALAGLPVAIDGLQDLRIEPGRRRAIRLGDHIKRDDLAVLVTSSEPLVAERDIYRVGGLGMSASAGIPLR